MLQRVLHEEVRVVELDEEVDDTAEGKDVDRLVVRLRAVVHLGGLYTEERSEVYNMLGIEARKRVPGTPCCDTQLEYRAPLHGMLNDEYIIYCSRLFLLLDGHTAERHGDHQTHYLLLCDIT